MVAVFGGSREALVVILRAEHRDPADGALLHAFDALDEERVGAGLKVAQEDPLARSRLPGGVANPQATGDIAAQWLGDVHVPARLDRRLHVLREAVGRRLHEDRFDAACDELLVGGQAREAAGLGHLELLAGRIRDLLEIIGDGDKSRIRHASAPCRQSSGRDRRAR